MEVVEAKYVLWE